MLCINYRNSTWYEVKNKIPNVTVKQKTCNKMYIL